jgi:inosine/xanthosine triphosphatase
MKTVIIASHNPVKIQATTNGFRAMLGEEFRVAPVAVSSGVRDQPLSDEETLRGALNRTERASILAPAADYCVGIEGGLEERADELAAFAWVVVRSLVTTGKARTASFFLPAQVTALIREGKELGEADDIVFGRENSKQENGAVGILTADVIDRAKLYEQAVILALIPFRNPQLYL